MTNEFDIILHPMILTWLTEFAKKEPLGLTYITKGNVPVFTELWGQSKDIVNKHHCWKRDYLGTTFFIYSNNEETYFKVEYLGNYDRFILDKKMGSYISGFLNNLISEITNDTQFSF